MSVVKQEKVMAVRAQLLKIEGIYQKCVKIPLKEHIFLKYIQIKTKIYDIL